MDTLYLVIVGAIGWAAFGGCVFLYWKNHGAEIRILRRVSHDDGFPVIGVPNGGFQQPTKIVPETIIESEIPEEMHRLAEIAEPLLDQYDTVPQSGEWKRHQVYAAMLKNPKVKEIIGDDKWKAGFALELAVAQRRMNAEEVGV